MKYLTESEEKKLLRTAKEVKGKKAERDFMILTLGFNTGLRLSEIIGLNVGDVRGKEKLFVRPEITKATKCYKDATGTTKKRSIGETIPINKKLQLAIKNFMKLKLSWREGIQDDAPLFISKKGSRISRRSLQEMFESWRDKSGIDNSYTVHSMRHTYAMRLRERGIDIGTVQKMMRHGSMSSTGVYFHTSMEAMQEAAEAL